VNSLNVNMIYVVESLKVSDEVDDNNTKADTEQHSRKLNRFFQDQ